MRFLCLPGMGTNAQILELQLSAITTRLSSHHEFTYLNGDVRSEPGQGIGGIFNGPYFSFWDVPTPDQLQAAVDLIEDTIEEDGPFDFILGYSQGAGMAATYLIEDARSPAPRNYFKGAIFINANMPFDPQSRLFKYNGRSFVWVDDGKPVNLDMRTDYPEVQSSQNCSLKALKTENAICQRYSTCSNPLISIPTIHIVGDADELYYTQGCRLAQLCEPIHRKILEYHGGHSPPKDVLNTSKIARAIESVLHQTLIG